MGKAVMGQMDKYMEVKSFEPINFRALPNSDMMFQVQWKFIWKETGVEMDHTAMVRKVINADNQICEKYHMCDVAAITNASPRDVHGRRGRGVNSVNPNAADVRAALA